ncbi:hypothetical protein, partial [Nocardioides panacihumi]|uniref:hypothetical protein n=1 Tax=Nocardioides panacihumi TaxID=400774 RepID=UPI0031DC2199
MTSHSWNEHTEPGARSSVRAAVAATALLAAVGVTTAAPSFAAPAHTRAAAQPAAAATERGALVLIGGALKEDPEILERIVALADPDGAG